MIEQIVKGHINELLNIGQDISENRLKICRKCPLYLKEWGGRCNPKLYLNPDTGDVSEYKKDNYFRGCGCRLLAKTTLVNASCPCNKW